MDALLVCLSSGRAGRLVVADPGTERWKWNWKWTKVDEDQSSAPRRCAHQQGCRGCDRGLLGPLGGSAGGGIVWNGPANSSPWPRIDCAHLSVCLSLGFLVRCNVPSAIQQDTLALATWNPPTGQTRPARRAAGRQRAEIKGQFLGLMHFLVGGFSHPTPLPPPAVQSTAAGSGANRESDSAALRNTPAWNLFLFQNHSSSSLTLLPSRVPQTDRPCLCSVHARHGSPCHPRQPQ